MEKNLKEKQLLASAEKEGNKLLVVIVNRGFADEVIEKSRAAGATGATILSGRGSAGVGEHFMGMTITPEKEVILILIKAELAAAVTKTIMEHSGIASAAGGICFNVPVSHITKQKKQSE